MQRDVGPGKDQLHELGRVGVRNVSKSAGGSREKAHADTDRPDASRHMCETARTAAPSAVNLKALMRSTREVT